MPDWCHWTKGRLVLPPPTDGATYHIIQIGWYWLYLVVWLISSFHHPLNGGPLYWESHDVHQTRKIPQLPPKEVLTGPQFPIYRTVHCSCKSDWCSVHRKTVFILYSIMCIQFVHRYAFHQIYAQFSFVVCCVTCKLNIKQKWFW